MGLAASIFEVLFFLTLLVYTAPHIMVFGAVLAVFTMFTSSPTRTISTRALATSSLVPLEMILISTTFFADFSGIRPSKRSKMIEMYNM